VALTATFTPQQSSGFTPSTQQGWSNQDWMQQPTPQQAAVFNAILKPPAKPGGATPPAGKAPGNPPWKPTPGAYDASEQREMSGIQLDYDNAVANANLQRANLYEKFYSPTNPFSEVAKLQHQNMIGARQNLNSAAAGGQQYSGSFNNAEKARGRSFVEQGQAVGDQFNQQSFDLSRQVQDAQAQARRLYEGVEFRKQQRISQDTEKTPVPESAINMNTGEVTSEGQKPTAKTNNSAVRALSGWGALRAEGIGKGRWKVRTVGGSLVTVRHTTKGWFLEKKGKGGRPVLVKIR
jgi:hypothetical protein